MKKLITLISFLALLLVSCKQETYYNITTKVEPEGSGSIVVTPSSGAVLDGTSVSFLAKPNGDYVFSEWSGGLSGEVNPQTVTLSSDLSVTAKFTLRSYPLTITVEGEGTVSEKVISTRSDYTAGTVVELNAIPTTGWSFDHWEGDLSGANNPVQITVSGTKSIKAVFTKNKYSYNLKIIGPGVVNEYLVEETKASIEYGTQILLKAIPNEGAIFKGWAGDLTGSEENKLVEPAETLDMTAIFGWKSRSFPLPDLKQPSESFQKLYIGMDQSPFQGHISLFVDYNRDNFLDLIVVETDWTENSRKPIRFYLGNHEGGFTPDPMNDNKIPGQIHPRKQVYGDFNNDGYPDILLIGHGWDQDPWPGEYPIILMSQGGPSYNDIRYTDYVSFYHGGATGDFDNDGDLDAFLVDSGRGLSVMMINDGAGNFSFRTDLINQDLMRSMYNSELYDVDRDGFLDLIVGAHDHEGPFPSWEEPFVYRNMPIVFWGDGKTYNNNNYTRLPQTNKWGFGLVSDLEFYDVDGDGTEEIILSRTGDGRADHSVPSYYGWDFQVLKREGRNFYDATSLLIEDTPYEQNEEWLVWLAFDTTDDGTFLIASSDIRMPNRNIIKPYFKLVDGKLSRIETIESSCLYADGFGTYDTHLDFACADDPYNGSTCMRVSQWPDGCIWAIDYSDWVDFSEYEKNGYCLEFAIKTDDPNLELAFSLETRLQTDPWYFPSYSRTFGANDFKHDGEWELIRIPLSEMRLDDEWQGGYYWNTIKSILLFASPYNGKVFYLDEIRIRKVLPE